MGLFSPYFLKKVGEFMKIILDPGHGGHDPGAVGPTGLKEKDVALSIAVKVGRILDYYGIQVIYTRKDDRFIEIPNRSKVANDAKVDYFVSIHINSATNSSATGTETFAHAQGTTGDKLANSIQENLVKEINLRDRGVKYANFAVLRQTNMPATLVEVAFINNPIEEKLLKSDEFQARVAAGIANGILKFLGVDYVEDKKTEPNQLKEIKIQVHGTPTTVEGVFLEGRNYIPITLLRQLGYDVTWNDATQTVVIEYRK